MEHNPKLYAMALGQTLMLLRERRNFRQAQVADQVGIPTSTMSTIEKGTGRVDTLTLQKLSTVLRMEPSRILASVDKGLGQAERLARCLGITAKFWWSSAQKRLGAQGVEALVKLAVAATIDA